ncbi:hypothetical protein FKM82_028805, partial [Ascaphus truei]
MAEDVQDAVLFQHQYMCSECGVLYNKLEDVLLHQQNHLGAAVQPSLAHDVSLDLGQLQDLVPENQYQCLECGQILVSPDELLQHQELHMRELPAAPAAPPSSLGRSQIHYQCCECKELFSSPELWLAHRQLAHREQQEEERVLLQSGAGIQTLLSLQSVLLDERTLNGWGVDVAAGEEAVPSASPTTPAESVALQDELVAPAEMHPYECSECSLEFHTPEEFLAHQGRHFAETDKESAASPACEVSENAAPSPAALERPGKEGKDGEGLGAEPRVYWCHECKKEYATAEELRRHRRDHQAESFPCPDCERLFTSANRLQSHRRVHVEGTLQCPNCYKVFKKEASLEQHLRAHRGESLYLCLDCGLGFGTEITLVLHRKGHTADPLHRCHCGKTFSNMTKFLYHRRTHVGKSGVPLPKPERPLVTGSGPARTDPPPPPPVSLPVLMGFPQAAKEAPDTPDPHENGHSAPAAPEAQPAAVSPSPNFRCPQCSKEFSSHLRMARHRRVVHALERKHKCTVCGKRFKKLVHVRNHMRVHTGERPFQCTDCGKTFGSLANLTRHHLTHTGEKPYRCDICGRGFTQSSNLQQHRTLHTGAFPCQICGLECSRASKLAVHLYGHTGVL